MVQASEETEQPDVAQAVNLFQEMNSNTSQVLQLVDNIVDRVKNGELTTEKGMSFLVLKYQTLLSYMINLTYVMLRKCSGEKIESDPAIDRLVELHTVLEKIRPIDSKLKYQVDNLVKTAVTGSATEDDPHAYRANPDNLSHKIKDSDDSSSDESTSNIEKHKSNVYVPPKLAAVHFNDDVTKASQDKTKSKKQFLNSSVMQELKEEYSEAPTEVSSGSHMKHAVSKYEQEKTEYEENYLTRLPVTKAEKNRRRKLTTIGILADEIIGSQRAVRKHKIKSKKGRGFKKRRTH